MSQFLSKLFENSKRLRYLRINNNNLSYLPDTICNLTCLQEFTADKNEIVSLPKKFSKLKHLYKIRLDDNKLTNLPDISRMPSLYNVSFRNNEIKYVSENILNHKKLKYLCLEKNSLSETPQKLQDALKDLFA